MRSQSKKRIKVVNNWFFDFNLILFNLKQHRQMFLQIAHFIQSFRNNEADKGASASSETASASSRAGQHSVSTGQITNDFKLVFRLLRKLQNSFSLSESNVQLTSETLAASAAASQASNHAEYRKMSSSKSKSQRSYWQTGGDGYKSEHTLLTREKFLEKTDEDLGGSDAAAVKSTAEDAYSLYELQSNAARSPIGAQPKEEFRDVLSDEIIIDHYKISFNTSSKKVTFLPALNSGSYPAAAHGSHSAGQASAALQHESSSQFMRKNRLIGDILNKSMIPPIILQRKQNDVSSYNKYSNKFHQKNINLLSSELIQKKPNLKPPSFQETENQQLPVSIPSKPPSGSAAKFTGSRAFSEKSLNTYEDASSSKTNKLPPINTSVETRDDLEVGGKSRTEGKKKKDLTRYCFYCNKKTGLASSYSCR